MSLPAILRTKPQATIDSMSVHTSILEPIINNQQICRFTLEKKGILDINSCVQVSRVYEAAGGMGYGGDVFCPVKAGAHSWIESATLRVGATAVATTDKYGHYANIKRLFKSAEERIRKDSIRVGSTTDGFEPANVANGQLQPMNLLWGRDENGVPKVNGIIHEELRITDEDQGEPDAVVFAIKLSELFPMMRNVQLPLYLMAEPVSIEIRWASDEKNHSFVTSDLAANQPQHAPIATTQIQFLADYLTYDDTKMGDLAQIAASEQGLTMPYNDIVLTTATVPSAGAAVVAGGAAIKQTVNREIGLAGRVVQNIVWADVPNSTNHWSLLPGTDAAAWTDLNGLYVGRDMCAGSEFNLRINDREFFNRPVSNVAQKAYYLQQTEGVDIQLPSCEYSMDQCTADGEWKEALRAFKDGAVGATVPKGVQSMEGYAIIDNRFTGLQHYEGVSLTSNPLTGTGTAIGQKPIMLNRTINRGFCDAPQQSLETYIWAQVERLFVLQGGIVSLTE